MTDPVTFTEVADSDSESEENSDESAFTDVVDSGTESTNDGEPSSKTPHVGVTQITDEFDDDTRIRPREKEGAERTYQSEDEEQGADDVDPRKLYREPSIDEVRWYYREGPFGSTITEKPIRDAFKHGYSVHNDRPGKVEPFLDRYVPKMIDAEIKARRDGFSVLFFQMRDSNSVSQSPENVSEITKLRVWPLERLTDDITPDEVAEHFEEYEHDQITVLDNDGIVVVDDIGHPDHGDLLGYARKDDGFGGTNTDGRPIFVHADRTQHFAWRKNVDGPIDQSTIGWLQGDSVLTPVLHSLKAMHKGVWGMGQTLFRYSAPLHVVETPEGYGEEDFDRVEGQMHALNSASSVTMPPGTEMKTHDAASDFDPEPFYESLVENVCAGTVFTKSVLKGTMTGSVSGSETDVKGYFSEVERYRQNRGRQKMREAVRMVSTWNRSIIPTFSLGYTLNYESIFKVDALDRTEAMTRAVTAITNGLQNYVLSVEDAQQVLEEEWAEIDVDVDLDELTEMEKDEIDRLSVNKNEQTMGSEEAEVDGNPRVGQNTTSPPNEGPEDQSNPNSR